MSKKPTNKGLSTLEKELLEYAGKGQPVLLYGKDTSCERVNLIKRIHLLNGGIDASWEYPGYNGNSKSSVVIHDAMTKALKEQGTKEAKAFLLECKNTSKTWRRVDCNFETGKEVFHVLNNKFELFSDGFNGRGLLETEESIKIRKLYKQHMDSLAKGYSFLFCRGLLFVDNLKCTRDDPEDHKWYLKLARSIELREKDRDSGDWLVVYAYDTKTFPPYFLDQFEAVPLDDEVEEPKDIIKGKLIDKIPSGTKWTEIEMSLVDKEYKTLDISIRGGKSFTVNPREIGLESNHTHKPLKAWWVLMAFAQSENGEIPSTGEALRDFAVSNYEMVPKEGKALFDHIDKLRKALSINFGISDDPVPHSADKEAYETLFRIKDTSYTEEHKKSSQNNEGANCNECGEVIKKLDHNNLDEEGNYICDKCKGASYDRLSKEGTYGEYPGEDE